MSTVHHAIVIEGERQAALQRVREYIETNLNLSLEANPDVNIVEYERVTIDDARTLKRRAAQTPLGERQVFVLAAHGIMHEAQNALLKLLEEPAPHTYFVLILPSAEQLLPTVRSRILRTIKVPGTFIDKEAADTFMRSSVAERLSMLSPIVQDKDRSRAQSFVNALEALLHADGTQKNVVQLREVAFVQQYLSDRSSSLKMLLEHLAVTL